MNNSMGCNEFTLCNHLSERIKNKGDEKGAGFYKLEQVKNSRVVMLGIVYKKSKQDNGLLLNVCPFCENKLGLFYELDKNGIIK